MAGPEAEESVRELCRAGAFDRAATSALEAYGAEIRRFISAQVDNEADAQDIFAVFCEDLWSGLAGFEWRCTLRGWAFTLARHAAIRYRATPLQLRARMVTFTNPQVLAYARSTTAPYARTDVKDRFRAIRGRLAEEDQTILVLRVDRDLGWRDIAQVLAGPTTPSPDQLHREEARIRKRFQIIKEKLRRWASDAGLLPRSTTA